MLINELLVGKNKIGTQDTPDEYGVFASKRLSNCYTPLMRLANFIQTIFLDTVPVVIRSPYDTHGKHIRRKSQAATDCGEQA